MTFLFEACFILKTENNYNLIKLVGIRSVSMNELKPVYAKVNLFLFFENQFLQSFFCRVRIRCFVCFVMAFTTDVKMFCKKEKAGI